MTWFLIIRSMPTGCKKFQRGLKREPYTLDEVYSTLIWWF